MKHFNNLTAALDAILINRAQGGYDYWTSFELVADRMNAKGEELAELYGTRLPAWKRQDLKQKGLPTCAAISAPVLGSPTKREFILMVTDKVRAAPPGSVWTREVWSDRSVAFGSFVMVKEPRLRRDYAWTWRLQEHIHEGIKRNLVRWVAYQKMRGLGAKNRDFINLKRIRNKLVAHRVPNELGGKRHQLWYKKRFGSFEKVLALILRVAEKLADRICRLQKSKRLPSVHGAQRVPPEITHGHIVDVLEALKKNGLY